MAMNAEGTSSVATELLFVYTHHNLPGISEDESVSYYTPTEFERARYDLRCHIENQLALFSHSYDYADCFSEDICDRPEEMVSVDELPIFRAALSAVDRQVPLKELHPRDVLRGL
jgi:hypothetical protein